MPKSRPIPQGILLLIITTFLFCLSSTSALAQSAPASEIIRLINEFRATKGLPPFRVNRSLSLAAQEQADFMAANNIFSHTGVGGSSPRDRAQAAGYNGFVSENIVGGGRMTAQQALIWWQNSPVHYSTITSQRYTEIGAGFAQESDQKFFAIVVGVPSDQPVDRAAADEPQNEPLRVIPIQLSEPREDGSILHTVTEGQSPWMLAAHYEVALEALLRINGLQEDSFLNPGDEIYIRLGEGQAPPPTPTPAYTYIVEEGDTAWTIAAAHDLTLEDFLWYNTLSENDLLQPGDEVIIRLREGQALPPTLTPQLLHIVREGDSLWGIAGLYGLTLEELLALNDFELEPLIQPGDELFIRAVPTEPAPTPTAAVLEAATLTPTPTVESSSDAASAAVALAPSPTAVATLTPNPTPPVSSESSPEMMTATTISGGLVLLAAVATLIFYLFWRQG